MSMAAIKLHGTAFSTATMRVMAALYEKGIEFQLIPVDLSSGNHKKQPYLSLNPFGQVPAFEDGDLKLFESRAITQYIADAYIDNKHYSECPKTKALTRVWMEVESQQFDPVAMKLAFEQVFKPMFNQTTDSAVVQENEKKLEKVLDVYEARLAESKYLAYDCFTLADMHHLPVIHYLMGTPTKRLFEDRPRVRAWIGILTARPAWNKVVAMLRK